MVVENQSLSNASQVYVEQSIIDHETEETEEEDTQIDMSSLKTPSSKAKASTGRSIKSSHRQCRSEEMTASQYYQEMLKIEKRKLKWQRRSYRLMREYYTAKLDILKAQGSSAHKDLESSANTSSGNGDWMQPYRSAVDANNCRPTVGLHSSVWETLHDSADTLHNVIVNNKSNY